MNLEDQVVSLPLAKKLKELGVKQDAYFKWEEREGGYLELFHSKATSLAHKYYSAFSVSELGEMLPSISFCWRIDNPGKTEWLCNDEEPIADNATRADTEANARANLLIHLVENGLMEIPK